MTVYDFCSFIVYLLELLTYISFACHSVPDHKILLQSCLVYCIVLLIFSRLSKLKFMTELDVLY